MLSTHLRATGQRTDVHSRRSTRTTMDVPGATVRHRGAMLAGGMTIVQRRS